MDEEAAPSKQGSAASSPSEPQFSDPPQLSGIAEAMKIQMGSWERGRATLEVTVGTEHVNKGGVAHGGLYSMLLDMALGGTLVSTLLVEQWCATTALNISFLEAAHIGDHLVATGRVVRRGRNVAHLTGEVVDQNGRSIATATGTWAIWETKPDKMPGRGS